MRLDKEKINRRNFLQSSLILLSGVIGAPLIRPEATSCSDRVPEVRNVGRVTRNSISIHTEPDKTSKRVRKIYRDDLIEIKKIVIANEPKSNPRWYQVGEGFVHSAYIQWIGDVHNNPALTSVKPTGLLGKITVPFTQSFIKNRQGYWVKLYRLYYDSIHWITGTAEDNEGNELYVLTDEWLGINLFVAAKHVQPVPDEELAPIVTTSENEKQIHVSLSDQTLTALEGNTVVRRYLISTGKKFMETPIGNFKVNRKFPSKHMGNGGLTSDPKAYELVGVPWVSFFTDTGIAFHGTFWHDNFGTPMSRGCVNMRNEDALWLFRWTSPGYLPNGENHPNWQVSSKEGTSVKVI